MKFSVYTVMTPEATPEELIPYLKQSGYDGVEWRVKEVPREVKNEKPSFWRNNLCTISPHASDQELENLKTLTEKNGLEVNGVTPYVDCGDLEGTEHMLQMANKLDTSAIRLGVPVYDRSAHYDDLFTDAVKYLNEAEQLCRQYSVKGLVETHHRTICPSASLTHRLVSKFDPEYIGVIYDPGNMVHEGYENYRMGLELLGPHLAHVHVKNAIWQISKQHSDGTITWQAEWSPVEKGIIDWKQVLTDLKAVGYNGYIGMEDFSGVYGMKEGLQHNLAHVKKLLDAI